MQRRKKGAFTLVELIVVIAIIAILTTVAIIGYNTYIEQANLSVDQTELRNMNNVIQLHMIQENKTEMDIHGVVKLLTEDNNFTLATKSKNYTYWFDRATNQLVMVKTNDFLYDGSENQEASVGKNSSFTFLSTSKTYVRDEVGAIAKDPRYILIDQSNKEIVTVVNSIRNLAESVSGPSDLVNKYNSLLAKIKDKNAQHVKTLITQEFNPENTLFIGDNRMVSASTNSVSKVIFNLGISSIPMNRSNVSVIELETLNIPSTVQYVSTGAFSTITSEIKIVPNNKNTLFLNNSVSSNILTKSKLTITDLSNFTKVEVEWSYNGSENEIVSYGDNMWYRIPTPNIKLNNMAYKAVFVGEEILNHYVMNILLFDETGKIVAANNYTGFITNIFVYSYADYTQNIYRYFVENPLINIMTNNSFNEVYEPEYFEIFAQFDYSGKKYYLKINPEDNEQLEFYNDLYEIISEDDDNIDTLKSNLSLEMIDGKHVIVSKDNEINPNKIIVCYKDTENNKIEILNKKIS